MRYFLASAFFLLAFFLALEWAGPYVLDPSLALSGLTGASDPASLRRAIGLDLPLWERTALALFEAATLSGSSWRMGLPVSLLFEQRLGISLRLIACGAVTAIILGGVVGYLAHHRALRWLAPVYGMLLALPAIVAASLAAAVTIREADGFDLFWAGTLSGAYGGIWVARAIKDGMSKLSREPFLLLQTMMGLPPRALLASRLRALASGALGALNNYLVMMLTGGTVVFEQAFRLEGIGAMLLDALFVMDLPVLRVALLWIMGLYIFFSAAILSLRLALDPRLGRLRW